MGRKKKTIVVVVLALACAAPAAAQNSDAHSTTAPFRVIVHEGQTVTLSADGSVLTSSSTATTARVSKTATALPDPSSPRTVEVAPGDFIVVPDAPQPQYAPAREKAGFWTFGSSDDLYPLRTNREVFHDKIFLTVQAIWLGSIVFDSEITHQGLAHHNCVENSINPDGDHPSRGALYAGDIPGFALGTAMNWLMMKYVSKSMIFTFPTYGSIKHFQGGSEWLQRCW